MANISDAKREAIDFALLTNKFITNAEVAREHGVSSSTVARRRKQLGLLPSTAQVVTAEERAKTKIQQDLYYSHEILIWIKKQHDKGTKLVTKAAILRKFPAITYDYLGYLATHHMTEMSAKMWTNQVLQTIPNGCFISGEFKPASRKVSLQKRKSANTIKRRDAQIRFAVGDQDERDAAEIILHECEIENINIRREERQQDIA